MSRIVETKVRIGVEAQGGDQAQALIGGVAKGAKDAQQAFIGLEQAQNNAYANITAMTPEVQNQVASLSDSFTKLRTEMATLPEGLKTAVDGVLSSLQAGNLQSATAITSSPVYRRAPEAVQSEVAQMFQSTYELSKAGVGVDFDKLSGSSAGGAGGEQFNSGRWKRLSGSYESRLDTFERRLDGAETDLDTMTPSNVREMRRRFGEIGSVGRQARGAAGPAQEDTLGSLDDRYAGYGTRLDDLIKQRSERGFNDGVETDEQTYSPNFERLFERRLGNIGAGVQGLSRSSPDGDLVNMERRLARAGGDLAYNQPAMGEDAFKNLSEGLKQQTDALGELLGSRRIENADRLGRPLEKRLAGLGGELDEVDPYTTSRRKLAGLRSRVNDAREDLAGLDGALEQKVFEDLTQSVEALTEKLDDNVQAYNESERGRSFSTDGEGSNGGIGQMITGQLERMGGGGMLGGLLGKVLPGAAVATGAVAAYNWADRAISGANRQARETGMAEADLARQYGIEGDPWTMFRSDQTGYTDPELLGRGYTGTDAESIMAQLDRPSGRGEAVEDVKDIAAFSYSTGLDESRVTDAVRMMGLAGTYKPGGAETPLETLKMALTEGVRNGVSQADTMNALVDLSQQALAQGRRLSPEALAFQASLQDVLAKTDNPLLKGQPGAETQGDLNAFVTGQGSPAMQMLLAPVLKGIDAESDLKLTGDAAKGFRELQRTDPLRAQIDALTMLADGRNPQMLGDLAARLDDALGGNPTMMSHFLDQAGITGEAKYAIMGQGLESIYRDAAEGTPGFTEGEDVATDVQGDNALSQSSAEIAAKTRDQAVADSKASVTATGQTEKTMQGTKRGVKGAINRFRNQAKDPYLLDERPLDDEGNVIDPIGDLLHLKRRRPAGEIAPAPPRPPAPQGPTSDIGDEVGRVAYHVMAGGLEGTVPYASNERTGAFGFSQVMPGNLIGDGKPDKNGLLQTGWDQSFLKTPEGKKWRNQLAQPGLNPNDPIPDQMAQIGVNDPNALPSWYNNLPQPAQKAMTGFVRDMTEYQLGRYYETARADGAGHDESVARTMAGWYGGSAWLDRDDPKRALSSNNPNFTRGHGANGEEPSVQEYINKALKNGTFDLPELREQSNQRVEVHVYGLDQIQVQGATQTAKATIRESINSIITAVSQPDAHHGMG